MAVVAAHLMQEYHGRDSGPALHMATIVELKAPAPPLLARSASICTSTLFTGEQVYLNEERTRVPTAAKYHTTPLELVHSVGDHYGPITPATPGGKRYFLLLVDNHNRFMSMFLLRTKDEGAATIRRFHAKAKKEMQRPMCVLRTDHGGEFTAHEFADWCAE
jgi:hypothetical protein